MPLLGKQRRPHADPELVDLHAAALCRYKVAEFMYNNQQAKRQDCQKDHTKGLQIQSLLSGLQKARAILRDQRARHAVAFQHVVERHLALHRHARHGFADKRRDLAETDFIL